MGLANNTLGRVYFGSIRIDEKGAESARMRQPGWYQLVMVLKGDGLYRDAQGRKYVLRRSHLIITTPEIPHQFGPSKGSAWSIGVLAFNGPLFDLLHQSGLLKCQEHPIALAPVDQWYRKFHAILQLKPDEIREPMRYLSRLHSFISCIPFERQMTHVDGKPAWLTTAITLIEAADQAKPLPVKQVAEKCKIGSETFRKQFSHYMGCGPSEYHKNLRIKTASELLAYGNTTIKQISQYLGFCNEFYFTKYFKEKTGLSPSQFKDELKKRNIKVIDSERFQKLALQEWFKAEEEKRLLEEKTAAERRRNWRLLFKEDFPGKDVAARWDIEGNWAVRNGELRVWGPESLCVTRKTPVPGDVRLVFDCQLESAYLSDISFILGALKISGNTVYESGGYFFQFGGWNNQRITLTGPNGILWNRHANPLVQGKRYHVDAQKIGNRLILKVDEQTIFDVRDPRPTFGGEHAFFGLYSFGTDIRYSNIQVYSRDSAAQADLLETAEDFMFRGDYHAAKSLFAEVISSSHDTRRTEQARNGMLDASRLISQVADFPTIKARLLKVWPTATIDLNSRGMIVDVRNAGISDLTPLHGLSLHELRCDHNQIANLQPLCGMDRLETLSCTDNQIRNLNPLRRTSLINLNCENNQVCSLDPLKGLKLRQLHCSNNHIASLEPLHGMELDELACGNNRIKDLEPLRGMHLSALSFPNNHVAQLAPVSGMLLSRLNCSSNQITDLTALQGMGLSVLRCSDNRITSLAPLRGIPLSFLQCSRNHICDLDPLRGMKLKVLTCHDNPVKSLKPIFDSLPKGLYVDLDALDAGERKSIEARTDEPGFAALLHNAEILSLFKQTCTPGAPTRRPRAVDSVTCIDKLKALAQISGNHRYLLVPLESTWSEAKKICEALGGHLAVILNPKDMADLQSKVPEGVEFWIGLHAEGQRLVWVTHEVNDFPEVATKINDGGAFYITSSGTRMEENRWIKAHGFCVEWDSGKSSRGVTIGRGASGGRARPGFQHAAAGQVHRTPSSPQPTNAPH